MSKTDKLLAKILVELRDINCSEEDYLPPRGGSRRPIDDDFFDGDNGYCEVCH